MPKHPPSARLVLLGALTLASVFCVFMLLVARPLLTGDAADEYLIWNLFLAWIPFVLALVFYDRVRANGLRGTEVAVGATWLAFLPNAPYILTDLIHLRTRSSADAIWFDALTFSAFAWTGLLLGLVALYLVHTAVARAVGAVWGWIVAFGAIAASGFGIYLGRFLRWNTWDIITSPIAVARDVAAPFLDPSANQLPIAVTGAFTAFLVVAYLVVYAFAHVRDRIRPTS
jgi:uncharacterized membrane protein